MKFPFILTNFKAYESAIGIQALELAKRHVEIAQETGVTMGVAVQSVDVFRVASQVALPVFAQHVDDIPYGAYTGSGLPEAVRQAGAFGTLLNHSEHRLSLEILEKTIRRAKEAGLFVIVCVETPEEGSQVLTFGPHCHCEEAFGARNDVM
jgi:triosephosphate isomerase